MTEKTLSLKKRKAVTALLCKSSLAEVATQVGTSERTLYRWLADTSFQTALAQAEAEALDQATKLLTVSAVTAITALADIVESTGTSDGNKIRAASVLLTHLPKIRLLSNIERRILDLEKN